MKKFLTFLFLVVITIAMVEVFAVEEGPDYGTVISTVGRIRKATGRPALGILPPYGQMTDEESTRRFIQQYGTPVATRSATKRDASKRLRIGKPGGLKSEKMNVDEWLAVYGQRSVEVQPAARAINPKLQLKAAPRAPEEKWVTTVTTNSDETLTIVLTKGTNTVTRFWHNAPVPFKWRAKFHELATDEDKANAISDVTAYLTETQPEYPIHSKYTEPRTGDDNLTAETYIIYGR